MINIENLVGEEIRKIIEFKDSNGEVQKIQIKNPSESLRKEFFNSITTEKNEEDDNFELEFLMKNLTNIELTKPLKEILKNEYINPVLDEVLKEMSNIVLELVERFSLNIEVNMEVDKAVSLLQQKKAEINEI